MKLTSTVTPARNSKCNHLYERFFCNKLLLHSRFCFIIIEQNKGLQHETICSYEGDTYCNFTYLNKKSGSDSVINISFLLTQHDERANTVNYKYINNSYDYGDDDDDDITKRRSCSCG